MIYCPLPTFSMSLTKSLCQQTTTHLSIATGCNPGLYPSHHHHHHHHHHSPSPSSSSSKVNAFVLNQTGNNQAKDSIFSEEDLLRISKHISNKSKPSNKTKPLHSMYGDEDIHTQHNNNNTHIGHHHNNHSLAHNHEFKENELADTLPPISSLSRSHSAQQQTSTCSHTHSPHTVPLHSHQHSWPLCAVSSAPPSAPLTNHREIDKSSPVHIENVIAGGLSIFNFAQFASDDEQQTSVHTNVHHNAHSEPLTHNPLNLKFSPWEDANDWNCVHIKL